MLLAMMYVIFGGLCVYSTWEVIEDFPEWLQEENNCSKHKSYVACAILCSGLAMVWPLYVLGYGAGYAFVSYLEKFKAKCHVMIEQWMEDTPYRYTYNEEDFVKVMLANISKVERPMLLRMIAFNGFGSYIKERKGNRYIADELANRDLLGVKE